MGFEHFSAAHPTKSAKQQISQTVQPAKTNKPDCFDRILFLIKLNSQNKQFMYWKVSLPKLDWDLKTNITLSWHFALHCGAPWKWLHYFSKQVPCSPKLDGSAEGTSVMWQTTSKPFPFTFSGILSPSFPPSHLCCYFRGISFN